MTEVADRGLVQCVPVGAGTLGVGDQHGAVHGRDVRDAGAAEHHEVRLGLVRDLEDGGVLQKGAQGVEGGSRVDLLERFGRSLGAEVELGGGSGMAERDVAGPGGAGRQRDADQGSAQGVGPVGLGCEREPARGAGLGEPFVQAGEVGDAFVAGEGGLFGWSTQLGGFGRLGGCPTLEAEAHGGAAEAHGVEPGDEGGAVRVLGAQLVQRQGQRDVAGEFDEAAADAGGFGVFDQHVAALAGLHGGCRGQDGVDGAELLDELGGGLRADAGDAGNVVDAVAHEGLDLGDEVGRDAELLDDLGGADRLLLDGVLHHDAVVDELHQVLVGGHDGGAPAGSGGRAGVAGDEVVGLPVGQLDRGDAEGGGGVADEGELRDQLRRRLGALGLVLVVQVVPEGGAPGIEDDGDVGAFVVLQQAGEHIGEAEDGVDGSAVGAGHGRKGVVGAEDEAGAVDEDEVRGWSGSGGLRSGRGRCPARQ